MSNIEKKIRGFGSDVNLTVPKPASIAIHVATALTVFGYSIYHSLAGEPLIALFTGLAALAACFSLYSKLRGGASPILFLAFSVFTSFAIALTSWHFGYRGLIMLFPYCAALIFMFNFRVAMWWGAGLSIFCLGLALNSIGLDQMVRFAVALMLSHILTSIYASKMLEQQNTLWLEANRDWLTGLMSRKRFNQKFEQFLEENRDDPGLFGMIYIDINYFKMINDQYGHAAGDDMLISVARRLKQTCVSLGYDSPQEIEEPPAARLSGDEFALVTCSLDTEQEVMEVAQALQESLNGSYQWNNSEIELGVSVGVFCGRYAQESLNSSLAKADAAMYFAKRDSSGKGLRLFDEEVEASYEQLFKPPVQRSD